MGRPKPFLFVVVRTNQTASGYDVVPAGSDEADHRVTVFGPAAEPVCWHHVVQVDRDAHRTQQAS